MYRQNLGQMLKAKLYRQNHTKKLTITQRSLHIDAHKRQIIYAVRGKKTSPLKNYSNNWLLKFRRPTTPGGSKMGPKSWYMTQNPMVSKINENYMGKQKLTLYKTATKQYYLNCGVKDRELKLKIIAYILRDGQKQ